MKKFTTGLLTGLALGGTLLVSLWQIEKSSPESQALGTLDFLITEWTAQREDPDTIQIAQIPHAELQDLRPGFFPDTVAALARTLEQVYRIPKGVTLSQWALESNWGRSDLGASNYFGHTLNAVKPYLRDTSWVLRRERTMVNGQIAAGRPVFFARYNSIAECFDTHGQYLTTSKRYATAFKQTSSERFARELSRGGYAEDPDYALKLIAIIRRYKLDDL